MAISAHHSARAHLGPLEHALDEGAKGDYDGSCVVHQAPPARFLDQQARGTRRVSTPDEGGHHMQSEAIRHSPRLDTCEVAAAIRAHQESFVADQGSSGLIRSHQESFVADQGSSGLIRSHQESSGVIRGPSG